MSLLWLVVPLGSLAPRPPGGGTQLPPGVTNNVGRHRLNYSSANDARRGAFDTRNRPIEATPEMLISHEYSRMIGARIRRLRRGIGMTLAETVAAVEHPRGGRYSTGLLSRIEKGWANPPLFVYIHIAEALGIEPAELLGSEDLPDPPPRGRL